MLGAPQIILIGQLDINHILDLSSSLDVIHSIDNLDGMHHQYHFLALLRRILLFSLAIGRLSPKPTYTNLLHIPYGTVLTRRLLQAFLLSRPVSRTVFL